DVTNQRPLREFKIPASGAPEPFSSLNYAAMALARDGSLLAASAPLPGGKGSMLIREAETGKLLQEIPQRFTALAFSPDAAQLSAGDEKGRIVVWSLPKFERIDLQTDVEAQIQCLAFSRDIRRGPIEKRSDAKSDWMLASGNAVGGVTIWDLKSRQARVHCRGSYWNVYAVTFSPDGTLLASGGRI